MSWFTHRTAPRGDAHIIENGSVGCPVQHRDVDIERCYMCSAFDDLAEEGGERVLLCSPRPARQRSGFDAFMPF